MILMQVQSWYFKEGPGSRHAPTQPTPDQSAILFRARWPQAVAYFTAANTACFVRGSVFFAFWAWQKSCSCPIFRTQPPPSIPSSNLLKKAQKSRHYRTLCDTISHDFVWKCATVRGHLCLEKPPNEAKSLLWRFDGAFCSGTFLGGRFGYF